MSETLHPTPIDPSDIDPNDVVAGEVIPERTDTSEQESGNERGERRGRILSSMGGAALGNRLRERREQRDQRRLNAAIDRAAAPERDLDNLVTDDREILGESRHLRRDMRDGTKDVINTVDNGLAKLRNLNPAAKARDAYLAFRRDRIALKVARLERLVSENPTSKRGKKHQKNLEMFKKRHAWRERQIQDRGKKYTSRVEKASKRVVKRNEKFQDQVDTYISKKIEAMRRKEQRKLMKTEGVSTLNPLNARERVQFLARLSPEEKKRLTREAILAVREKNIRKGKLDWSHEIDETKDTRKMHDYGRTA